MKKKNEQSSEIDQILNLPTYTWECQKRKKEKNRIKKIRI